MRSVRKGGWERGRRLGVRGVRERRWERGRWLGVRGVRERGRERCSWGRWRWYSGAAGCSIYTRQGLCSLYIHECLYYITYRLFRVGVCGRERAWQLQKEEVVGEVRLALWGCRLHSKQFYSCLKNLRYVYTSSAVFERGRVP